MQGVNSASRGTDTSAAQQVKTRYGTYIFCKCFYFVNTCFFFFIFICLFFVILWQSHLPLLLFPRFSCRTLTLKKSKNTEGYSNQCNSFYKTGVEKLAKFVVKPTFLKTFYTKKSKLYCFSLKKLIYFFSTLFFYKLFLQLFSRRFVKMRPAPHISIVICVLQCFVVVVALLVLSPFILYT